MAREKVKSNSNVGTKNNYHNGTEDIYEVEKDNEIVLEDVSRESVKVKKKLRKDAKLFALFCVILFFIFSATSPMASKNNRYELSAEEMESGIIQEIKPGKLISIPAEEEKERSFTIENSTNEENTKIILWDYADEDGDYVQIFVNGFSISDVFMLKNKPIEISVPASGVIEVKGVKDGAGGITYAVKCQLNGKTYINSASEGEVNKYTFV